MNRTTRRGAVAAILSSLVCGLAGAGLPTGVVWGLKSQGVGATPSLPPTRLFRFDPSGGGFVDVGAVTLAGAQSDVDALAVLPSGALRAFRRDGSAWQLVDISPVTAVATAIGTAIAGRELRGAVALDESTLLVLDAAQNELLRIDAGSGAVLGDPLPLVLGCQPFALSNACDLAMRDDGLVHLVAGERIHLLSTQTGRMELRFVDTVPIPPSAVSYAGAAFGAGATASRLLAYEVNGPEDIASFDTADGFARTLLFQNIIPGFNAGRGDLASWIDATPVEPDFVFADLNGDGTVDGSDLGLLLGAWGPCRGCCADLNRDGAIDGADLGLLLGAWTG